MAHVSAVVFDVSIESEAHTAAEVMHRVFAQTSGVHLRARSPLIYQSGRYVRAMANPEVWTGRLERIREGPRSTVVQGDDGSYDFIDAREAVPTSHATTYYAFAPQGRVLVYRDTAEMPYTRLKSYVSEALRQAAQEGFHAWCEINPRTTSRPLREWLLHFTSIERVRVQFQHSRSPGNRAIDSILEQLNAETATEIVTAAPKQNLNKEALLDIDLPIGQAIDHLEQAPKNGNAQIVGRVGDELVKFDTNNPVERHLLDVDDDIDGLRSGFARFAAKLCELVATLER